MVHDNREVIEKYIAFELDDETQIEVEEHLETCEDCVAVYVELLEAQSFELSISDDFTDKTIRKINQQVPLKSKSQPNSNQKQKVAHFLLAAGLTILLMITGVFQQFLSITSNTELEKQSSLTEQLMDKTDGILEQMKGVYKE